MSGAEYDQEKFERSNGSTLCRKQLLFGKCSAGKDCPWKHDIEPGEVAPLCRDHFLRKNVCPRMDACPLAHVQSGNLPSNILKEAQVGESRSSLSQISRPSSGAGGDGIGRQLVSKQQRDAAMASLTKTRVDNRGANKVKSASEAQNSVMDGGVLLASETNLPETETPMDYNTPSPRHAADPNITVGRPDKGAIRSAGTYDNFDAMEPRYFDSDETLQYGQNSRVNNPRGGATPAVNHSQSSWDVSMNNGPISDLPSFNPSPNRQTSYQGVGRETSRPPLHQNDVMHQQRVMNYDQQPQPTRTNYYPCRPNYQNNERNNSFRRNGSGFQENSNGGRYQDQVFNSNTTLPRANDTGGSQQYFKPGGQSSAHSAPIGRVFPVSASQTDPASPNRNGSKSAVNIQSEIVQVMRGAGGNFAAPRDVMSLKRMNGGRGPLRTFGRPNFPNNQGAGNPGAPHQFSLGRGAGNPRFPGSGRAIATRPGFDSGQGQINYNHHHVAPVVNRCGGGLLNAGGYTNGRGTTARQHFTTPPGRFRGSFETDTGTNGYTGFPVDHNYQSEYSISRNNSGMPSFVRESPSDTVAENPRYSSVSSNPPSDNTAIMSLQNHDRASDLNTRSGMNYQSERRNSSQDGKSLYSVVNGDAVVALVDQTPPGREAENGHAPINNKHQTEYTGKQSFAGPSNLTDDNHAVKYRGIRNYYDGVYPELRRPYRSGSDMGVHEPGIFHEQVDSSDSESQHSGRYTPELAQPADLPICHSPEPGIDRSALRLFYANQREKNYEMNPNRANFLLPEKRESSKKKVPARKHERTPSEDKLILAANLQKPGQFTRGNAHVSEEKSVERRFKSQSPPLPTPVSPLTPTPSLPVAAPPTPSLPMAAPPTPSLPVAAPPTPSLPMEAPPTPSLPMAAPPTPSLPMEAPPTPSLPAAAPPTPSLPMEAPPTPSLPMEAPPTPSLPMAAPPTPSLPMEAPPTPSLPVVAPPTPSLPAAAPPTPSLPAATPSLTPPASPEPSLTAPVSPFSPLSSPPPEPSLTAPAPPPSPLSSPPPSATVAVSASKPNPRCKKRSGKVKPSATVAISAGVSISIPSHVSENIPVPAPSFEQVEQNRKVISSPDPWVANERLGVRPHTIPQKRTCWLCEGHHEGPCEANSLVSSKTRGKQANNDGGTWDYQGISKHWSDDEFIEKQMTRKSRKSKGRVTKAHAVRDFPDQDDNGGVPLGKFMGAETAQSTKPCSKKREKRKTLKEGVPLGEGLEREEPVPEEFSEEFLEASKSCRPRSVMTRADGDHTGGYFDGGGSSGIRKLPEDILMTIFSYLADGLMPEDQMEAKNVHIGNSFRFDSSFTTTRYRRLGGVLRSCHYWRYLGQQIVCKYINLTKLQSFRRFVRTISEDEELGNMVRAIKVNIHGGASYMTHDRRFSKHTIVEMPKVSDLAQLFTRMMRSCPQLQVLSVNMHGAIMGFNVVFQKFPMMREIQIKDDRSKGVVAQNVWADLSNNYPNLENFRIFHSQENVATNFDTLKIAPKLFQLKGTNEIILKALTMERCPELSDRSLTALSPKLKNLTTLVIVDCKLVTSGGLARAIEKLPDPSQITRLIYFVWVDPFGKSTPDEMCPTRSHLCTAIRDHCTNVSYICWKPYRICGDFWKGSNFHSLERCRIEPMSFKDCDKDVCDYSKFTEAYKQAREEGGLPKLEEDRVFFDFYF